LAPALLLRAEDFGPADQDPRIDAEPPAEQAEDHHRPYSEAAPPARHPHAASIFDVVAARQFIETHDRPPVVGLPAWRVSATPRFQSSQSRERKGDRSRCAPCFTPVTASARGQAGTALSSF
jgi:hypothetical protein